MRFIRFPHLVSTVVVLGGLVAAAVFFGKTMPGKLRRIDLSKNDLSPIPLLGAGAQPAMKVEWSFWGSGYARAVLERRDIPGTAWKQVGLFPWGMPCQKATILFQLGELLPHRSGTAYSIPLSLRIGGSWGNPLAVLPLPGTVVGGGPVSGWTGSSLLLDLPVHEFQTENHFDDPECLLLVTSGHRTYRLRLERDYKPFGPALISMH